MSETRTNTNAADPEIRIVTDEEWAAGQREAMGDNYPGDEAMQRERDAFVEEMNAREAAAEAPAEAAEAAPAAEPAPASQAEAKEWNAREWLNEVFKDDPTFKDLSEQDMSRLEALANEKRDEIAGDVQEWAAEKIPEWTRELKDGVEEGLASSPALQTFAETHLADGEFSETDKAALKDIAEDMTPAEAAGVVRPVVEAVHDIHGDLIDGVEMIVDHAVEDIHEIVDVRAEMPGGDGAEVQSLQQKLEEAPAEIDHVFQFEREQADYEWGKIEDRLELVEAGTDPKDLPPDTDTYQVDDNADQYESAEA